jgi:hypothetical protein
MSQAHLKGPGGWLFVDFDSRLHNKVLIQCRFEGVMGGIGQVTPGFLLFWLQSELTMGECARRRRLGQASAGLSTQNDILPERRG